MKGKNLLISGFLTVFGSLGLIGLPVLSIALSTDYASSAVLFETGTNPGLHFAFRYVLKRNPQTVVKKPKKEMQPTQKKYVASLQSGIELHPSVQYSDIHQNHQRIISETLAALPQKCTSALQKMYVRYEKPKSRGLAGKTSIILDGTVSDDEFRALFIHEFGHIIDLGCFEGTQFGGNSEFKDGTEQIFKDDLSVNYYSISWKNAKTKRETTTKEDFVSGYASWDPFEDFAEGFVYYILQREEFEKRALSNEALQKKLSWFEKNIGVGEDLATGKSQWKNKVPWDITKLAYEWNG